MRARVLLFFSFLLLISGPCPGDQSRIRIATFNIAMGLEQQGQMAAALESGIDQRLQHVAEILQTVRPDIVLLNEFDYDPEIDAAQLLNENYLALDRNASLPIYYPFHFRAAVNTGIDSGLDLDRDGAVGGPGDAWGFGYFPGQFGMLVLSRFPLEHTQARTFGNFLWKDMPGARRPLNPDGSSFHPDALWAQLRLSSKSHWSLVIDTDTTQLHLLAHHPTPPVFDGAEDRNGRRNADEIRFWRDYTFPRGMNYMQDDQGRAGGIGSDTHFVIVGDFNADPVDGDSVDGAIAQLLDAPWIDASCLPSSSGGAEAAGQQGGANTDQQGDPAADTADFNDRYTGNLRIDYVLPSANLEVLDCGVYWPATGEPGHRAISVSDHRLVWLDIKL